MIPGNIWCDGASGPSDYDLCNQTWEDATNARFCNDLYKFNAATIQDVVESQVWNRDDEEVGRGMEVLWYTSVNMLKYQPTTSAAGSGTFYLYVANSLNTTEGMNVVHDALYARKVRDMHVSCHMPPLPFLTSPLPGALLQYADLAAEAGVNATVYYTDYHGMSPTDDERISTEHGGTVREVSNAPSALCELPPIPSHSTPSHPIPPPLPLHVPASPPVPSCSLPTTGLELPQLSRLARHTGSGGRR